MRPVLVLLALSGCTTAASYNDKSAAAFCKKAEECFGAEFAASWDNQKECRDDVDYSACPPEHCTFDAKAASKCLAEVNKQACDDFGGNEVISACSEVWTDCDFIALAVCFAEEGLTFDTL
jgi:hypothetical protein